MTSSMEMALKHGLMEQNMRENMLMGTSKDSVSLCGQTARFTKGNSETTALRELVTFPSLERAIIYIFCAKGLISGTMGVFM